LAKRIIHRHITDSDQMAAVQLQLRKLLEKRTMLCTVKAGDKVWLDSKHTPVDISYKPTARWFGLFEVLEARGAKVTLGLNIW